MTLPVAFWSAAAGGGLATIVAIALVGEALSLTAGLAALALSRTWVVDREVELAAEGI